MIQCSLISLLIFCAKIQILCLIFFVYNLFVLIFVYFLNFYFDSMCFSCAVLFGDSRLAGMILPALASISEGYGLPMLFGCLPSESDDLSISTSQRVMNTRGLLSLL
jgi:hypothetical protein